VICSSARAGPAANASVAAMASNVMRMENTGTGTAF
jgi:hypothetical protein